jgi:lipopolysaccharide transport system permease protein
MTAHAAPVAVRAPRQSNAAVNPLRMPALLFAQRHLILALTRRDLAERFRGTLLGVLWFGLGPAILVGVYTLTFGVVFKARVPYATAAAAGNGVFGVFLFSGLVPFTIFADVLVRSPAIVTSRANYVTKVVFPLEVLSAVAVFSALSGGVLSSMILLVALALATGGIPLAALAYVPCLLLMVPLLMGLSWILAALGTYVRDLGQITSLMLTVCMFVSPIFTPIDRFPRQAQPWLRLNPVTVPVDTAQRLLFVGALPSPVTVATYVGAGLVVMAIGWTVFQALRKGFADVL